MTLPHCSAFYLHYYSCSVAHRQPYSVLFKRTSQNWRPLQSYGKPKTVNHYSPLTHCPNLLLNDVFLRPYRLAVCRLPISPDTPRLGWITNRHSTSRMRRNAAAVDGSSSGSDLRLYDRAARRAKAPDIRSRSPAICCGPCRMAKAILSMAFMKLVPRWQFLPCCNSRRLVRRDTVGIRK